MSRRDLDIASDHGKLICYSCLWPGGYPLSDKNVYIGMGQLYVVMRSCILAEDNLRWQAKLARKGVLEQFKDDYWNESIYTFPAKCPEPILAHSKIKIEVDL